MQKTYGEYDTFFLFRKMKIPFHNNEKRIIDFERNSKVNFKDQCKELVEKFLKSLPDIGANMNIKVHFIRNHLDKLLDNCSDLCNEQGEWFHQDIKTMEECNLCGTNEW